MQGLFKKKYETHHDAGNGKPIYSFDFGLKFSVNCGLVSVIFAIANAV
jgi:hypothetical protein